MVPNMAPKSSQPGRNQAQLALAKRFALAVVCPEAPRTPGCGFEKQPGQDIPTRSFFLANYIQLIEARFEVTRAL